MRSFSIFSGYLHILVTQVEFTMHNEIVERKTYCFVEGNSVLTPKYLFSRVLDENKDFKMRIEWIDVCSAKSFCCDIDLSCRIKDLQFVLSSNDTRLTIRFNEEELFYILYGDYTKTCILGQYKGDQNNIDLEQLYPPFNSLFKNGKAIHFDIPDTLKINAIKQMSTFCYRYLLGNWNENEQLCDDDKKMALEFDWVEEVLWDGTHDKLHDGSLMRYHAAGKPRKLAVKFHVGKDEYSAYFWMDEVRTREIFDRFYGAHRDTKCDFIIHIDPESRRYELALFRYGLQEPQVLPADAFEVLVFKNRFEHYRSDNYSQPRGAWIW